MEENITKVAQNELELMKLKSKAFDISMQQETLQMQINQLQQTKMQILKQIADLETEMKREKSGK